MWGIFLLPWKLCYVIIPLVLCSFVWLAVFYYLIVIHSFLLYFLLVVRLLYKSKCPSVCQSVRVSVCQPRLGGNLIFSDPNWDIAPIFFVQNPLINEHLFCKYFVRLSVGNATKGFAIYRCCHPCFSSHCYFLN